MEDWTDLTAKRAHEICEALGVDVSDVVRRGRVVQMVVASLMKDAAKDSHEGNSAVVGGVIAALCEFWAKGLPDGGKNKEGRDETKAALTFLIEAYIEDVMAKGATL